MLLYITEKEDFFNGLLENQVPVHGMSDYWSQFSTRISRSTTSTVLSPLKSQAGS
jgi:hypothetical protein